MGLKEIMLSFYFIVFLQNIAGEILVMLKYLLHTGGFLNSENSRTIGWRARILSDSSAAIPLILPACTPQTAAVYRSCLNTWPSDRFARIRLGPFPHFSFSCVAQSRTRSARYFTTVTDAHRQEMHRKLEYVSDAFHISAQSVFIQFLCEGAGRLMHRHAQPSQRSSVLQCMCASLRSHLISQ